MSNIKPDDYRILIDLLDIGEKCDLMISLSGINTENLHELLPFLRDLNSSDYSFDLYVGLMGERLDLVESQISIQLTNLLQMSPNKILVTLTSDEKNIRLLHTRIAGLKHKTYRYLISITMGKTEDLGFPDFKLLKRGVSIMDSRPDLASVGNRKNLSYLDDVESTSLKNFFSFGKNYDPYALKLAIISDFISEYYDRDISCTFYLFEHHNKVNNFFTRFQSFDLAKGVALHGEDESIRSELKSKLKSGEEMPNSTALIEYVYRSEGVPRFLRGFSITRYSLWQEFSKQVIDRFGGVNETQGSGAVIVTPSDGWLDRAMGIEFYRTGNWIGGIQDAEIIKPLTIVACHFKNNQKEVNEIIKRNHLKSICNLSKKVIAVYSTDNLEIENEFMPWFRNLEREYNFTYIPDHLNMGFDLSKWMMVLEREKIDPSFLNWVWLTNDSWFSCRSLQDWLNYYSGRIDLGLVGLTDNLEHRYHIQSYSWLLNSRHLQSFINWNRNNSRHSYDVTVHRNEIGFCNFMMSRGIRIESYYNTVRYYPYNLFTMRSKLFEVIERHRFPIVKLRFFFDQSKGDRYQSKSKDRLNQVNHSSLSENSQKSDIIDPDYLKLLQRIWGNSVLKDDLF